MDNSLTSCLFRCEIIHVFRKMKQFMLLTVAAVPEAVPVL